VIRFGLLGALLSLTLAVYALVDCAQRPSYQLRTLPKAIWLLLIVLLPLLGSLAYLLLGRDPDGQGYAIPRRPRDAPSGPDDDEAYLRSLRERAQQQRDEYRRQQLDRKLDEWEQTQHPDGSGSEGP